MSKDTQQKQEAEDSHIELQAPNRNELWLVGGFETSKSTSVAYFLSDTQDHVF